MMIATSLLLIGYKTRIMTFLCWVGIISIQNRNPLICQGGDDLLRMLFFWLMFLRVNPQEKFQIPTINCVASMAILCQLLFPFFFSAFFKGQFEWWTEGSALYYALSLDQLTRNLGIWLTNYYSFTQVLTRMVYLSEFALLPMFLFPIFREHIRIFLAIFILLFNLGIIMTMKIGIFPYCFIAGSVLFIPTHLWDKIYKFNMTKLQDITLSESILKSILVGFLFTLVILWNICSLPASFLKFPKTLMPLIYSLRLNQSWGMFAPTVYKEDGWLIYLIKFKNNKIIDLNNKDNKVSFEKPNFVLDKYKNERWRKYTEKIISHSNIKLLPYLRDYILYTNKNRLRKINSDVISMDIIYMLEMSNPHGVPNQIKKRLIYSSILK
jgi:hypothetical protein